MPLEAGSAMHEVFAAVRLYQLYAYDAPKELAEQFLDYHGARLFNTPDNPERFSNMRTHLFTDEDERTRYMNFCLDALYSSGFYDDPSDRRRTMANLEEAAMVYIDRWDWKRHPIWIRDRDDPTSDVGIEIAFDIVVCFTFANGNKTKLRFIGKFDGVHTRDGHICIGENKTASRADEAWRMSFTMSSQVTGYMLAASVWIGEVVNRAMIWGSVLPLPKSMDGVVTEYVTRKEHHFARWFDWFLHSAEYYSHFRNNPHDAPKYTHSCNRYFRPCSFIPFCDSDDEDQKLMIEEMVTEEWTPLDDAKQGGD
jgi:hypothetical protein